MSIPTLLIFKNGQIVDKHVGVASKGDLKKKIEAAMA
jgi:thioredoxin 1